MVPKRCAQKKLMTKFMQLFCSALVETFFLHGKSHDYSKGCIGGQTKALDKLNPPHFHSLRNMFLDLSQKRQTCQELYFTFLFVFELPTVTLNLPKFCRFTTPKPGRLRGLRCRPVILFAQFG